MKKNTSFGQREKSQVAVLTRPGITTLLATCLVGVLLGGLLSFVMVSDFGTAVGSDTQTQQVGANTTAADDDVPKTSDYMDAYVWTARVRLEALGLDRYLRVSATENNQIFVSGQLLPGLESRYEMFKTWFNAHETFPPLVDEVNVIKATGNFPRVLSVWLGDKPSVHLETGTNVGIGGNIGDGWTVVAINALALILERDGTVIELSHAEG